MVRTHSTSFWCWDKPRATLDSLDSPRPGLEGSHHLPPYSIFYAFSRRLHPNGSFSWDSQGGVPNLFPGWTPGTLGAHISWLRPPIQVRSQQKLYLSLASLTLDLSFVQNLSCRCPNDSCEAILDIYTLRPFPWYKEHFNARCFDPCNHLLSFRESRRTTNSHFWECECRLHTSFKMGLW